MAGRVARGEPVTKALRSVPLMTLRALTSCGIPVTGVVEAGGPASGTLPMTRVYFVENGALVAMPRTTELPGDPEAALQLLMAGPLAGEGRSGEPKHDGCHVGRLVVTDGVVGG
ncbi:hypothetical protein [Streptomyces cellulosae]|uniref:Uncharacterized protein n=1 Tax=Streptomyces cellulosae TaxID=1968 RepID=A0ABW7YI60_STRCE